MPNSRKPIEGPLIFSAPGRINLIGEHIDYNDGPVLPIAINRSITIKAKGRNDSFIDAYSAKYKQSVLFSFQTSANFPCGHWGNYLVGVASLLNKILGPLKGVTCEISSSLPEDGGLSSSAALEIAFGLALIKINGLSLAPMQLAKLCRQAEQEFAGVSCGLMDQVAVLFGKAKHATYFDSYADTIEHVMVPKGYSILAIASGEKRSLYTSAYNMRHEECRQAKYILRRILGISSFRQVDSLRIKRMRSAMPPVLHRRATHIVEEIARTQQTVLALQTNNMASVGHLMNESHQSLDQLFEVSTPKINRQVAAIQALPGIMGARLCGGGFGGYIIVLVHTDAINGIKRQLTELTQKQIIPGNYFVSQPMNGALQCL